MLKIGLTGGIGSGKSTIAKIFNDEYKIPIIDADVIARQLVAVGQPALTSLQQHFGKLIINDDGSLHRDKLRTIIFSDSDKKQKLEKILHPLIYQQMQSELDEQTSAYCILCIPLLLETYMTTYVDRILVVDCAVETQVERVSYRDKWSKNTILSIISSQVSREYRISHADDIVDNSNSTCQLAQQVKKLHNQYLLLSNS